MAFVGVSRVRPTRPSHWRIMFGGFGPNKSYQSVAPRETIHPFIHRIQTYIVRMNVCMLQAYRSGESREAGRTALMLCSCSAFFLGNPALQ